MTKKKDASLNALFDESEAPAIEEKPQVVKAKSLPAKKVQKKGRPVEYTVKRQQIPVTIPEPLYFELLDWVNLRKRDSKRFSMNEIMLEALELWLRSNGKPSIQEIANK